MTPASVAAGDAWADWLLRDRYGTSTQVELAVKTSLLHWRNEVLRRALIRPGDTVLDVGTGDGLVGLGALGLVGAAGRVIFSDISPRLLQESRGAVEASGLPGTCEYLLAPAEDLSQVPDATVDVVTMRSVLMHVEERPRALAEFARVLRAGGRLSAFESVARLVADDGPHQLRGYDVAPVQHLVARVLASAPGGSLTATPTMLGLDHQELVGIALAAGFAGVRLSLEIEADHPNPARDWDFFYSVPVHPGLPTLEMTAGAVLSEQELEVLVAHLRPLVEAGAGVRRQAVAYLAATMA